jgi:hypothetical protein
VIWKHRLKKPVPEVYRPGRFLQEEELQLAAMIFAVAELLAAVEATAGRAVKLGLSTTPSRAGGI